MNMLLRCLALGVVAVVLVSCASSKREEGRPDFYQGGQYYEDAVHAQDLKAR